MTILTILANCDEALRRPQDASAMEGFRKIQKISVGLLKEEGFPVTEQNGNMMIETDGKIYYAAAADVAVADKESAAPAKPDVGFVEYVEEDTAPEMPAKQPEPIAEKERPAHKEETRPKDISESPEEPEPVEIEEPAGEPEEEENTLWNDVDTEEPEEERKHLEDEPDEPAGDVFDDFEINVDDEPEEPEGEPDEPDFDAGEEPGLNAEQKEKAPEKRREKQEEDESPIQFRDKNAVEGGRRPKPDNKEPEENSRDRDHPKKKDVVVKKPVSQVRARSKMRHEDFTYVRCRMQLMKDDEKVADVSSLIYPIDIDIRNTEFVMAVGKGKRIIALTSSDGLIRTEIADGIHANVRGFMDGEDFEVRVSLPRNVEEEGYRLKVTTSENGTLGHIIQEDDGIRIHVFPISTKNDQFGNANFIYYLESTEETRTGITDRDSDVTFRYNGGTWRLKCVWDEETKVLDSSIAPVS